VAAFATWGGFSASAAPEEDRESSGQEDRQMQGILALEDGQVFWGEAFGAEGERAGEVVFNTSMTGYEEVLTDPSYKGQIVTMTYPHIGNYGINDEDFESTSVHVDGFVVRDLSASFSNWRAQQRLDDFLKRRGIIGLNEVDTRALTRHIRSRGAMKAVVSTVDDNPESLIEKARRSPGLIGRDLVKEVTCPEPYHWDENIRAPWRLTYPADGHHTFHVVVYDFGVKHNILRCARDLGLDLTVVPASTTAKETLELHPDGILLSNGPGDPEALPYAVEAIRELMQHKPVFGICLGHQLMGLALGGRTYKLKFGHRGSNQPVRNHATGQIEITSQNHGFAVAADSLGPDVEVTHLNLNDQTVEGLRHKSLPAFSVQYHPEASAGPHDARYLFDDFLRLMQANS
jgi:carbamoyl-phosphate synthase small subunit